MFNILVVEDDAGTRKLLCALLKSDGYNVLSAQDGAEALEVLDKNHVDLLVIDVMMPRMDGYTLTEQLRGGGSTLPMLMLSAKDGAADVRHGFVVGIDDYMKKPFDVEELLLRIRALLRRAKIATEKKIVAGSVTLDYDSLTVTTDKGRETLPQKEFLLLFKLLSYPDVVFTRLQLMDEIWGMDAESDEHTVNVHINRLRTRFAHCDDFEIVTVRGLGYKAVRKNVGEDGR
ncbi:MAG TPA: response regulator transcription factor [Candidatus Fimimonas merdipullorum]|uniref:Heme response regulator HssR n=1 Tax=Candidatus Fimimonas merdipullorum TaxID=2840822 RepID=A0A9D1SPU2_9BACT|nr:response regulator transcription factor [Candidatus Fimimonas merdipullorum]